MSERSSTRLEIPHPSEPGCNIVGILEQISTDLQDKKIALILHGSAGHKDYLFLKRLAVRLPMNSFRFDFRGNHETPGKWNQSGMESDLEDLRVVVEYLKKTYDYAVDLIVGHSRGSLVGFRWMCVSEEGKRVSGFVNASARYRMKNIYDAPGVVQWQKNLAEQGFHVWTPVVARKTVQFTIYPGDVERFANWDSSLVWDHFPAATDVLTIHGLSDKTVPPYDAIIYARALGARSPGTHNLHYVEGADHNFTGIQDEIVEVILDWWQKKNSKPLKTGIWMTGTKVKL